MGAAAFSALGLVVAGIVAARATASAARTSTEATQAVAAARTEGDCEALVRALARSYDELRLWARNPAGEPPEPTERARRYLETGS
ncbi:hypothetical protein ACFPC0_11175 [Streptomyces andamanensis]|uniref:Uncharacterized protein n=1 Tax=Streptomyces andamanensis TaxID=1565035 RepID=A0ABV8TCS6_9ACTN